jgi:hypothetical protein
LMTLFLRTHPPKANWYGFNCFIIYIMFCHHGTCFYIWYHIYHVLMILIEYLHVFFSFL